MSFEIGQSDYFENRPWPFTVYINFLSLAFQRFVSVLDFETDLIVTPQYKVCITIHYKD